MWSSKALNNCQISAAAIIGKMKAIHEVRTKMVGGTHYAFEFELQDGQVWNAIVLHSARGDYMIERHAKKGELCPKEGES